MNFVFCPKVTLHKFSNIDEAIQEDSLWLVMIGLDEW